MELIDRNLVAVRHWIAELIGPQTQENAMLDDLVSYLPRLTCFASVESLSFTSFASIVRLPTDMCVIQTPIL